MFGEFETDYGNIIPYYEIGRTYVDTSDGKVVHRSFVYIHTQSESVNAKVKWGDMPGISNNIILSLTDKGGSYIIEPYLMYK